MESNIEEIIDIDPLSAAPVFIDLLFDDIKLATGTAFFIKRDSAMYLITNWHNLAGRNSLTNAPLDPNLSIPNTVRVYHHNCEQLENTVEMKYRIRDENDQPLWLEHPIHKSKVDVGVLQLHDVDIMSKKL